MIELFRKKMLAANYFSKENIEHCVKSPYLELFWSAFSSIRTEYREIRSISPNSVQMRENADQNNSEYGHFSRSGIQRCNISDIIYSDITYSDEIYETIHVLIEQTIRTTRLKLAKKLDRIKNNCGWEV